ncbi:hypothetical protein [Niveibacterium sp. SC-1]|uniref:hypothetical protein n=1 Tax=Niveibacterium sp. SC-1 TaxID=3135646 RepID=UPI00311DEA67
MKVLVLVLTLLTAFLGYRVIGLEQQVRQLQTNTAIAILSAEAANNKVGAIAPYFAQDKEAFAKAWLDSNNLPLAVFPEEVLVPLKRSLEEKRSSKEAQALKASIFK